MLKRSQSLEFFLAAGRDAKGAPSSELSTRELVSATPASERSPGGIFDNLSSRRAKLDAWHRSQVLKALGSEAISAGQYRWLFDPEQAEPGKRQMLRKTVLAELGRLGAGDVIRQVAAYLCEIQPKTSREAVVLVRRWRLGGAQPAAARQLTVELANTIDTYAGCHPETTWELVQVALVSVIRTVENKSRAGVSLSKIAPWPTLAPRKTP